MSKTAAVEVQPTATVPLKLITKDQPNHRTTLDPVKMAELIQSIREKGVLVPVCVRPTPDGKTAYGLVYGYRRCAAAEEAGLDAVPAIVLDLRDDEVLEVALIENVTREDVGPLDEGEAYLALHMKHDRSVEEIAARTGKSAATIRARMKLCDLTKPGKEALLAGALSASAALHVARVPTTMQAKLVKDIAHGPAGTLSDREVRELVRREYMLDLTKAPFDPADATLCPSAGACSNCPKRTGAQPELFSDVSEKDLCTDPPCHREKVSADWKAKEAAAAAGTGPKVVPAADAKRVFDELGSLRHDAPFLDANLSCHDDEKYRTYKALLGKLFKDSVVLGKRPNGEVVELLPKKGLKELLDDAGKIQRHEAAEKKPSTSKEEKAAREAEAKKASIRREAMKRMAGLVVAKVEAKDFGKKEWRLLVDQMLRDRYADETIERRFPVDADGYEAAKKWVEKASAEQLRGFAFECSMQAVLYVGRSSSPTSARALKELLEHFKLDPKKVEADVKADAKTKAAEEAKAAKLAPAEALFKGKCRVCHCTDAKPCKVEGQADGCAWVDEEETLCTECVELEPGDKPHGKKKGKG